MAYITGLLLIDAPASALNNAGSIPGERTDNTVAVKSIRARDGIYPYVSAQAFRYWLRTSLTESQTGGWISAPVFRETKVAYADGNPLKYWDDDLFGYMRAPSKKDDARRGRDADASRINETATTDTLTRASPFRVSTLVSLAPLQQLTTDFGVMSRHDENPVIHEHQFYRTTLKGLFSLNLAATGTFSYRTKTGYRNLDDGRKEEAKRMGLHHLEAQQAYRLPRDQRARRVSALMDGLANLQGGAKQAIHYTDVNPSLILLAVTRGGNHIFHHAVRADSRGLPQINIEALQEALSVFRDDLLSPVYVGWPKGYLADEHRNAVQEALNLAGQTQPIVHPREAIQSFALALLHPTNAGWLE